jgi:hypothetical protein
VRLERCCANSMVEVKSLFYKNFSQRAYELRFLYAFALTGWPLSIIGLGLRTE